MKSLFRYLIMLFGLTGFSMLITLQAEAYEGIPGLHFEGNLDDEIDRRVKEIRQRKEKIIKQIQLESGKISNALRGTGSDDFYLSLANLISQLESQNAAHGARIKEILIRLSHSSSDQYNKSMRNLADILGNYMKDGDTETLQISSLSTQPVPVAEALFLFVVTAAVHQESAIENSAVSLIKNTAPSDNCCGQWLVIYNEQLSLLELAEDLYIATVVFPYVLHFSYEESSSRATGLRYHRQEKMSDRDIPACPRKNRSSKHVLESWKLP